MRVYTFSQLFSLAQSDAVYQYISNDEYHYVALLAIKNRGVGNHPFSWKSLSKKYLGKLEVDKSSKQSAVMIKPAK